MGVTPKHALRYPEGGDPFTVHTDIRELAEDVDNVIPVAGSVLASAAILEPGIVGQRRAGRVLTLGDFTTILGLAAPAGLWPGDDENDDSGNARNLSVRGAVPHGTGIMGVANEAWVFDGGDDALYIADAAWNSIKFGSWGCWFRAARSGMSALVSKWATGDSYMLRVNSGFGSLDGVVRVATLTTIATGGTVVTDDRWHFAVVTYDGTHVRVYLDGRLEVVAATAGGPIDDQAGAFNIGAAGADAATAAVSSHAGRIQNAFITPEILSEEQIRFLFCAKIAHLVTGTPSSIELAIRRRRRGGPLVTGDFPVAGNVDRLYNLTDGSLVDAGADAANLTNNGALACPGADGLDGDAFNFDGVDDSLSATDTGLPAGLAARSYGVWFKTVSTVLGYVISYGNAATAMGLYVDADGKITQSGLGPVGPAVNDGRWHFVVIVDEEGAADGLKRKLYLDGALVSSNTQALVNVVLGGAGFFRVGSRSDAASFFKGQIDLPFVYGGALSGDDIAKLWTVGSLSLGLSPKNAGDHVERIDTTNLYVILDGLESCDLVDLKVRV